MVDQNQTGSQLDNQPVMGGNPYDLVDNKNLDGGAQSVENNANISTKQQNILNNVVDQENTTSGQEIPVKNTSNTFVDENAIQVKQNVQNQSSKPVENKGPNNFTKNFIKFIAKLSGQPDPETGDNKKLQNTSNNQNISQNNANTTNSISKNKNAFDNIMGGVTGFLDKVEKKVEGVSGIDLDASINNGKLNEEGNQSNQVHQEVENHQVPLEKQQVSVQPEQQKSSVEQGKKTESVQQNTVEQNVQKEVKQDLTNQDNKQQNIEKKMIGNQGQTQIQQEIPVGNEIEQNQNIEQKKEIDVNSEINDTAPDLGAPPNLDLNKSM